ncbi:unnamed protein product, partial [Cyprideis torosa]
MGCSRPVPNDNHGADDHGAYNHGADDHGTYNHGADDHGANNHGADDHGGYNHGADDHGAYNHGADDHGAYNHRADDHGANNHGADDHGAYNHDHGANNHDHGANNHGADDHGAYNHGADGHGANNHGADNHGAEDHRADDQGDGVTDVASTKHITFVKGHVISHTTEDYVQQPWVNDWKLTLLEALTLVPPDTNVYVNTGPATIGLFCTAGAICETNPPTDGHVFFRISDGTQEYGPFNISLNGSGPVLLSFPFPKVNSPYNITATGYNMVSEQFFTMGAFEVCVADTIVLYDENGNIHLTAKAPNDFNFYDPGSAVIAFNLTEEGFHKLTMEACNNVSGCIKSSWPMVVEIVGDVRNVAVNDFQLILPPGELHPLEIRFGSLGGETCLMVDYGDGSVMELYGDFATCNDKGFGTYVADVPLTNPLNLTHVYEPPDATYNVTAFAWNSRSYTTYTLVVVAANVTACSTPLVYIDPHDDVVMKKDSVLISGRVTLNCALDYSTKKLWRVWPSDPTTREESGAEITISTTLSSYNKSALDVLPRSLPYGFYLLRYSVQMTGFLNTAAGNLTIPKASFVSEGFYYLRLVVRRDSRKAETKLLVEIKNGYGFPNVEIKCVNPSACEVADDGTGITINPTDQFPLEGACMTGCPQPENLIYRWEVMYIPNPTGNPIPVADDGLREDLSKYPIGISDFQTVLGNGFFDILNANQSNQFRVKLSITDSTTDKTGCAVYNINMNRPPIGGTCALTIKPPRANVTYGIVVKDVHSIACSGWVDLERHQINKYTYYAVEKETDERRDLASSQFTTQDFYLAYGVWDLYVEIWDEKGAYTTVQLPRVTMGIPATEEEFLNLTNKMFVAQLKASGDQSLYNSFGQAEASVLAYADYYSFDQFDPSADQDELLAIMLNVQTKITNSLGEKVESATLDSVDSVNQMGSYMSSVVGSMKEDELSKLLIGTAGRDAVADGMVMSYEALLRLDEEGKIPNPETVYPSLKNCLTVQSAVTQAMAGVFPDTNCEITPQCEAWKVPAIDSAGISTMDWSNPPEEYDHEVPETEELERCCYANALGSYEAERQTEELDYACTGMAFLAAKKMYVGQKKLMQTANNVTTLVQ